MDFGDPQQETTSRWFQSRHSCDRDPQLANLTIMGPRGCSQRF
jgi:hypothetical protein